MTFIDNLKETIDKSYNISITENGAVGYRTTGKKLLDFSFSVSSLRNCSEDEIYIKYNDVVNENKLLAVKWLFYISDIRGGLGERRLFRICFKFLALNYPELAKAVIEFIPEYNRWDNIISAFDTDIEDTALSIIKKQLLADVENMKNKTKVSLCAKWMPSVNASSVISKNNAKKIIKKLGVTNGEYRKILSSLRNYLNITEVLISRKEWATVNYSQVPSKANIIYSNAFLRNDKERRKIYLEKLSNGEVKINAGVLFPHDIVHKYMDGMYSCRKLDNTLEELWKQLSSELPELENTICVADGSGSMMCRVSNTNVTALDVANSLAIFCAEKCKGEFKNKYITFSMNPQLVELRGSTLRSKINTALLHDECANTNIEGVFNLILETAVKSNSIQEELPKNIIILSDMEFDSCACNNEEYISDNRLFKKIKRKYELYGYKVPKLVFWNIISRTNTIPMKENSMGVVLVSGFSPNILKMVLSNKTDPFECLMEQINSERYKPIEQAITKG